LWSYGEAKPHVDAGIVRLLGVASATPLENEPNLETWQEGGLNVPQWSTFRGWAVPANTPETAVEYLANLLAQVNKDLGYIAKMQAQGYPLAFRDSEAYAEVIASYDELTRPIITAMRRN
jgi:tripartite-type tricarboxylate transporter receptor subunit TctC